MREVASNEVYEENIAHILALKMMEAKDEKLKKRERFWRVAGKVGAVAPLIAATALVTTEGKKMDGAKKIGDEVIAAAGGAFLGLIGLYKGDIAREKAQQQASEAAPISYALNRTIQPWIAQRLAEKAADEQKRRANLGQSG